ncbi:hypothetical protein QR98_0039080, partial [Sarcoptes scabiei]
KNPQKVWSITRRNSLLVFSRLTSCCNRGIVWSVRNRKCSTQNHSNTNHSIRMISCKEIFKYCCEQKIRQQQCDRGIFAAQFLLQTSKLSCERQFLYDRNNPLIESYRCCSNCLQGITIASKYQSKLKCEEYREKIQSNFLNQNYLPNTFDECCLDLIENNDNNDSQQSLRKNFSNRISRDSKIESNDDSFEIDTEQFMKVYLRLRCDNTIGSYRCVRILDCGTGYLVNADTNECEDIDECLANTHFCSEDFRCRNTKGSFKCERFRCQNGLKLIDGICRNVTCSQLDYVFNFTSLTCQPRPNPCDNDPCPIDQQCSLDENDRNRFVCQKFCEQGYQFNRTSKKCEDIDECDTGLARCSSDKICQNFNGYYRCVCREGFHLNDRYQCVDIDECLSIDIMNECWQQNKICHNTIGSYSCRCDRGYYWNESTKQCSDIDECKAEWNRCEHDCINIVGSYRCQCRSGFRLKVNQHNCTDINECDIEPRKCFGLCQNTIGSFECRCPDIGFKMSTSNRCEDIDECLDNDACPLGTHCINLYGSYQCVNFVCPWMYSFNRTDLVLQCRWPENNSERPYNRYHTIDQIYMNIFPNQTRHITKLSRNYFQLYAIRFDSNFRFYHHQMRPRFEFRFKSAEWQTISPHRLADFDPDTIEIEARFNRTSEAIKLASLNDFELRTNLGQNEAIIVIVRPLFGPQKIQLEFYAEGYRSAKFQNHFIQINLFINEFDQF